MQDLRRHLNSQTSNHTKSRNSGTPKKNIYKNKNSPDYLRFLTPIFRIFGVALAQIFKLFQYLFYRLEGKVGRLFFIQTVFVIASSLVIYNLWFVFSTNTANVTSNLNSYIQLVPAKRGNIYYRNLKFNKVIPLTTSEASATISFDPQYLAINIKNNIFKLDDVIYELAANLNIPYSELQNTLKTAVNKATPARDAILKKAATTSQGIAVETLQVSSSPLKFGLWLSYKTVETRSYPEEKLLGNVLGYVQRYKSIRDEAYDIKQCQAMIDANEKRSTVDTYSGKNSDGVYTRGVYGIEQKFCSELGGLNGREQLNSDDRTSKDGIVQDGADINLTIDSTLQAKAEEILANAIAGTTMNNKTPRNGSILIMNMEDFGDMKAGEILADASWPTADPNNYDSEKYVENGGFLNVNTSEGYEVGSVFKPITVASALNEWVNNAKNQNGERTGLDPNWQFVSAGPKGKVYVDKNGLETSIKNSDNTWDYTYGRGNPYTPLPIKECLRNSINTCLTEIELHTSNSEEQIRNEKFYSHSVSENYYSQKFGFGRPTLADLPPSTNGDISNFKAYEDSTIQYAYFSFGQGFTATPMQMARAYSPIIRLDGTMVEPHLVKSIRYDNGSIDEATTSTNPAIAVGKPIPTLNPQVSGYLNDWLKYTLDNYGKESVDHGEADDSRGFVKGYPMAAKTGTSQVSRPDLRKTGVCNANESDYQCTTRLGIFDESFQQFGPVGPAYAGKYPKIFVFLKVSEANPGQIYNFSLLNLGKYISQMSKFTLDYLGVPPNLQP